MPADQAWMPSSADVASASPAAPITIRMRTRLPLSTASAGTQPEAILRLAGKGLPRFGGVGTEPRAGARLRQRR